MSQGRAHQCSVTSVCWKSLRNHYVKVAFPVCWNSFVAQLVPMDCCRLYNSFFFLFLRCTLYLTVIFCPLGFLDCISLWITLPMSPCSAPSSSFASIPVPWRGHRTVKWGPQWQGESGKGGLELSDRAITYSEGQFGACGDGRRQHHKIFRLFLWEIIDIFN